MKTSSSRPLLRWTFYRAGRYVICQVSQSGQVFRLSLHGLAIERQPHTTTFASGLQAMQRHAEVARALRAAGWVVASYTDTAIAEPRQRRAA